jgi:hypothetical protein
MVTSCSTCTCGRVGYAKLTSVGHWTILVGFSAVLVDGALRMAALLLRSSLPALQQRPCH